MHSTKVGPHSLLDLWRRSSSEEEQQRGGAVRRSRPVYSFTSVPPPPASGEGCQIGPDFPCAAAAGGCQISPCSNLATPAGCILPFLPAPRHGSPASLPPTDPPQYPPSPRRVATINPFWNQVSCAFARCRFWFLMDRGGRTPCREGAVRG